MIPVYNPLAIVEVYQKRIDQYHTRLHTCPLSPMKILAGFNSYWWLSLKYIPLLLSLSCDRYMLQPLYRSLLPRIRVLRTYLKCMITAHPAVGSLDLGSIEVEQIIETSNLFVTLYLSQTLSSQLLRDSLELMQVEVELDCPVLEENYSDFGHLVTKGWLQSLWELLSFFGIKLHVPSHNYLVSLKTNNVLIRSF